MAQDYGIFSPAHFAILASIPLAAAALTAWARRRPQSTAIIRKVIGITLIVNELATYVDRTAHGWMRFPDALPLQLSDFTLWLTIFTLLRPSKSTFDIVYYLGLAGAGLTCVTPELFAPLWALQSIQFFIAHGGVVVAVLYLVWTRQARPRPHSMWKAFAAAFGWALFVGAFNLVYKTNYMFLCRKPAGTTPLDIFVPWPAYLFVTAAVALGLFTLLWLPYRRPPVAPAHSLRT
jgi:hypothetical integral membrane protein (TIGR02206 family)